MENGGAMPPVSKARGADDRLCRAGRTCLLGNAQGQTDKISFVGLTGLYRQPGRLHGFDRLVDGVHEKPQILADEQAGGLLLCRLQQRLAP